MVGPNTSALGLCTGSSGLRFCVLHVIEPVVLQLALARLIADGAIDGVVEQKELLDRVARLLDVLARVAHDLHASAAGHLARGLELRLLTGT